ncbi:MAG: stage IV sporulation protein A [Firmicutes bacterium]|nr:stage IV sporulation protein A [Bacillota bacterium]
MAEYSIYDDIAERSQGDVYIGVVGPVRTGKSVFIKRFMDLIVIPNITNTYQAERTRDELPQSAAGKTIMTTEPKFVPNEAVEISLGDNAHLKVRMIDCVGYVVNSSLGYIEDEHPRMVNTPWSSSPIPFDEAAEIGTKKVINEHSTICLVITTDGSDAEIDRTDYTDAENRVINELKAINKPFIILLNCADPTAESAQELRAELERKHGVPVMAINCLELDTADINEIIETVLFEFPLREIVISTPRWLESVDDEHWLKQALNAAVKSGIENVSKIRNVRSLAERLGECDFAKKCFIDGIDLGKGTAKICLEMPETLFYKVLGEQSGFEIESEQGLMSLLKELAEVKKKYDRVKFALAEVRDKGYGVVYPTPDEMSLEEPKIVKQGGRYGIKLKAAAPSIHMMRAEIETEVNPIVGTEKQSKELVDYLLSEFEEDPQKIWESNIFGKSLYDLVNEGLNNKLSKLPEDARTKLRDTFE